MNKLFLLHKII